MAASSTAATIWSGLLWTKNFTRSWEIEIMKGLLLFIIIFLFGLEGFTEIMSASVFYSPDRSYRVLRGYQCTLWARTSTGLAIPGLPLCPLQTSLSTWGFRGSPTLAWTLWISMSWLCLRSGGLGRRVRAASTEVASILCNGRNLRVWATCGGQHKNCNTTNQWN